MRASQPALLAAGRVIAELRDQMVVQWADWLGDRITAAPTIPRPLVEREFRILLDIISEMVGPLRREVGTGLAPRLRALRPDRRHARAGRGRGGRGAAVPPRAAHPQSRAGARRHARPPGHGHHAPPQPGHRQGYRGRGRGVHRRAGRHAVRPERRAGLRRPSTTPARSSASSTRIEQELHGLIEAAER